MLKIAVVDDEIVFVESLINKITAVYSLLSGYKIKYSRHTKVNLERDWLFLF